MAEYCLLSKRPLSLSRNITWFYLFEFDSWCGCNLFRILAIRLYSFAMVEAVRKGPLHLKSVVGHKGICFRVSHGYHIQVTKLSI